VVNAFIEFLEEIIVNERDRDILNDEFLFSLALVRAGPKVDGSRIHFAAVFKPD
jgi:hypothetical protein